MNIAVSQAFGVLRVVVSKSEIEKNSILGKVVDIAGERNRGHNTLSLFDGDGPFPSML